MYKVIVNKKVAGHFSKISPELVKRIIFKIYNHLASDPRLLGKPLKGEFKGYRIYECYDDYRVIYKLLEADKAIEILAVGHRKDIYRK